MKLIDTHCHPQMGDYDTDRDAMIGRALDTDTGLIAIGTNLVDSLAGVRLAEKYPQQPVYAAVGVHPTDDDAEAFRPGDLEALLNNDKVVGIGETGLDYFRLAPDDDRQLQIDLFEQQIIVALSNDLPLIIHCRDKNGVYGAYDDVFRTLIRHQVKKFVMHCFSGDAKYAEKFLGLGGMLSFTGIITFPKSESMQQIVTNTPLDRIMVETDAPFLAPQEFRGQRNEPIWVKSVADKMAEIRGISSEEIAKITTENAVKFFNLK